MAVGAVSMVFHLRAWFWKVSIVRSTLLQSHLRHSNNVAQMTSCDKQTASSVPVRLQAAAYEALGCINKSFVGFQTAFFVHHTLLMD